MANEYHKKSIEINKHIYHGKPNQSLVYILKNLGDDYDAIEERYQATKYHKESRKVKELIKDSEYINNDMFFVNIPSSWWSSATTYRENDQATEQYGDSIKIISDIIYTALHLDIDDNTDIDMPLLGLE